MFGVGYLPLAPGTWGSFAAILIWYASPLPEYPLIFLLLTIVVIFTGLIITGTVAKEEGMKDPSYIVIDEWAGQWIALLFVERSLILAGISFLVFRILDIWKPGSIKRADSREGGTGIMGDDIIAGIGSLVVVQIVRILL